VTAHLKKAGAIIIGLTNTPEFSMRGFTDNPLHGPTMNPWNSAITCGGSSGGAGASIAAGIGTIAHGNDIGGSLRWPAFCNGIATIKPTQGRIPAFNPSAPAERPLMAQFMSAQGPLAREVRDVRLGLAAMSGRDMRDPWWVPAPLEGPPLTKPIKVALARIPDDMDTDADVMALVRTAADHLASAGYDVTEAQVPDLAGTWRLWCDLIMTELSVLQEAQMRAHGSADFRRTLDGFLKMATILDGRASMEAIARRSRVLRDWLAFLEIYSVALTRLCVKRTPEAHADLDGDARVRSLFWNDLRFMSSINVLGLPAAVVPVGLAGAIRSACNSLRRATAKMSAWTLPLPSRPRWRSWRSGCGNEADLVGGERRIPVYDSVTAGLWGALRVADQPTAPGRRWENLFESSIAMGDLCSGI
jgi:amidase